MALYLGSITSFGTLRSDVTFCSCSLLGFRGCFGWTSGRRAPLLFLLLGLELWRRWRMRLYLWGSSLPTKSITSAPILLWSSMRCTSLLPIYLAHPMPPFSHRDLPEGLNERHTVTSSPNILREAQTHWDCVGPLEPAHWKADLWPDATLLH
jgi:hypothetical protein